MTYGTVGLIIATAGMLVGVWCGYKQDNAYPVFSLIYMVITGFGYLIGIGAKILKDLLA